MAEAMQGGDRPASPELAAGPLAHAVQLTTPKANASTGSPRVLSEKAREQLAQAMDHKGFHIKRMAKKAGRSRAEDMWQKIIISFENVLRNQGPVEHLESYLNRCVTNELSKLRATIEVVVGDETLDLLRAKSMSDPQLDSILSYNIDLIEAVQGIRASGVLSKREADVYVLAQVLGEENDVVAEWLDPPTTAAAVATLKWKAMRKVKKARREGKFRHLGFPPPRGESED
jgi:DNA-directed RNA polymerase specialized sigma24 family protein